LDDLSAFAKHVDSIGATCLEAEIEWNTIEDLLRGESERACSSFYRQVSHPVYNGPNPKATYLSFVVTFYCAHGPEDHRVPKANVPDSEERATSGSGSRPQNKKSRGDRCRVGCKVSFKVFQRVLRPDVALVRWKEFMQHCGHGPTCAQAAGTVQAVPP
jgi:hypothetical protein